jgi:anaerobic selenocysteine-containing dehydrogenase
MSKKDKSTSRRDFLKMSAVGAPAVAAVSLVGNNAVADETKKKAGLQKGAYYKKYLELAKF